LAILSEVVKIGTKWGGRSMSFVTTFGRSSLLGLIGPGHGI
jgi:hypothetical protein